MRGMIKPLLGKITGRGEFFMGCVGLYAYAVLIILVLKRLFFHELRGLRLFL